MQKCCVHHANKMPWYLYNANDYVQQVQQTWMLNFKVIITLYYIVVLPLWTFCVELPMYKNQRPREASVCTVAWYGVCTLNPLSPPICLAGWTKWTQRPGPLQLSGRSAWGCGSLSDRHSISLPPGSSIKDKDQKGTSSYAMLALLSSICSFDLLYRSISPFYPLLFMPPPLPCICTFSCFWNLALCVSVVWPATRLEGVALEVTLNKNRKSGQWHRRVCSWPSKLLTVDHLSINVNV